MRLHLVIGRGADRLEAATLVEWALGLPLRIIQPFLLPHLPASSNQPIRATRSRIWPGKLAGQRYIVGRDHCAN
jgi:hypothetical protein